MASLREYYDSDFNYATRFLIKAAGPADNIIEGAVLYDFASLICFSMFYVPGLDRPYEFFEQLIPLVAPGGKVSFEGNITLPSGRQFPGSLHIKNLGQSVEVMGRFHGEPDWISTSEIGTSRRIFIYSETQLEAESIRRLASYGRNLEEKVYLQFRSSEFAKERSKMEKPLAFISYDSKDREAVASPMARELIRMMCPVWYDEYSLTVGDNLHDKIMDGLKSCKKCILVLSPNFFSNKGWTKKEFESVFTREILEQKQLVLPVW